MGVRGSPEERKGGVVVWGMGRTLGSWSGGRRGDGKTKERERFVDIQRESSQIPSRYPSDLWVRGGGRGGDRVDWRTLPPTSDTPVRRDWRSKVWDPPPDVS